MAGKLLQLRKICMFVCAFLVLVYLSLLCLANPSKELIFAISVELLSFGAYIFFYLRRRRGAAAQAGDAVITELSKQFTVVHKLRRAVLWCTTAFWLCAAFTLTLDCAAFSAAFCEHTDLSAAIYRTYPISHAFGLHPGASLEVLAGAYVEAKKYDKAQPLYDEVMDLRLKTFGPVHKEMAALYCDFGDLYTHQGQLARAEKYYRQALSISTALLGDKGSGRAFTRLADCLRDQGRYEEATRQYQIAYDMRCKQFGANSSKVGETLAEWVKLCRLQGLQKEADRMQARVSAIEARQVKVPPLAGTIVSIALFAVSLFVSNFFLGRKGVLTELVVGRMKASLDAQADGTGTAESAAAVRKRLTRLVTLCRFQKKFEEAEHYNALLLALASKPD